VGVNGNAGTAPITPATPGQPSTAGVGAAGAAGMNGAAGGGAAGAAGMSGAAGMGAAGMGAAGMGGSGVPPSPVGVEPSEITLSTLAANGTVGLEWSRVLGATGYRVYWSMSPGVTPQTGQAIDAPEPAYVHRGLTNGTQYYYVVTSLLASGEGPAAPEASATPGGEWVLEQLGSGDFNDLAGGRVPRVPIAERVHVLLVAEGYLASELGIFHDHAQHNLEDPSNDVDRWIAEVFNLVPYSGLREAFVIWYMARASNTHIDGGDTAFGDDAEPAAGPLFDALDASGPDAFPFPLTADAQNYAASFLLFDPGRGRAGVSGHATTCRHPTDTDLRIGCAFGVGHAHEFTHVFSQVRDEYMENDNTARQGTETSNVVPTNMCAELPWAHLLEGRGINQTPGLVGAFGRPERGYHSEFLCAMNGTHENGQYWCQPDDEQYTTLTLRPQRFCNWCRELTGYHIFRRTGILPASDPFATWTSMYQMAFWDTFGFFVPETVPQLVECNRGETGTPVYEACMP
jgi:hypothetical protein